MAAPRRWDSMFTKHMRMRRRLLFASARREHRRLRQPDRSPRARGLRGGPRRPGRRRRPRDRASTPAPTCARRTPEKRTRCRPSTCTRRTSVVPYDCPDAASTLHLRHQQHEQPLQLLPSRGGVHADRDHRLPRRSPRERRLLDGRRPQRHRVRGLLRDGQRQRGGRPFRVSTATAACEPTPFAKSQQGFALTFGMGFSQDEGDAGETLYVASRSTRPAARELATIDVTNGYDADTSWATSTPDHLARSSPAPARADLFGFWDPTGNNSDPSSAIVQIDKTTAQVTNQSTLPGVEQGTGWAFAFWGGDFYTFTAPGLDHPGPPLPPERRLDRPGLADRRRSSSAPASRRARRSSSRTAAWPPAGCPSSRLGPGDPGLVGGRAAERLAAADVVVHAEEGRTGTELAQLALGGQARRAGRDGGRARVGGGRRRGPRGGAGREPRSRSCPAWALARPAAAFAGVVGRRRAGAARPGGARGRARAAGTRSSRSWSHAGAPSQRVIVTTAGEARRRAPRSSGPTTGDPRRHRRAGRRAALVRAAPPLRQARARHPAPGAGAGRSAAALLRDEGAEAVVVPTDRASCPRPIPAPLARALEGLRAGDLRVGRLHQRQRRRAHLGRPIEAAAEATRASSARARLAAIGPATASALGRPRPARRRHRPRSSAARGSRPRCWRR